MNTYTACIQLARPSTMITVYMHGGGFINVDIMHSVRDVHAYDLGDQPSFISVHP